MLLWVYHEFNNIALVIISVTDCNVYQTKAMSYSQGAVAALLVALVVGVQGHQIIYVDTENGTLNSSCWEGGLDHPCSSLELAETGAKRYNSTVAVLQRYGSSISTLTRDKECNELAIGHKYNLMSAQVVNASCPPWFKSSNGTCKCGEDIDGIVKCNETLQESAILDCYCMTYNESTGTVVGACFYNCVLNWEDFVYHPMPKTAEQLNDAICSHFNRSGQLCGECKIGYSPPVYAYSLHCIRCSGGQYNWIKYIVIAFLPLTVFLVLVFCCRISATSPQLYAFVMFSQFISSPANVRVILAAINASNYPYASIAIQILATLHGFWNLDFFRTLSSHVICLNVNMLQALALDYGIAFYPLALIIITYLLIELHDHNCRVIVLVWRPFHRCFARFRRKWDIRASIIDVFATFLLLSNIKILSVSTDLLTPTYVYYMNGSVVGIYLYYDGSVEYFGTNKHLPYAIFAVFVVLIFIIFPILFLLLYPMRWFQRCLVCGVRWHALNIFIDVFQGYYKDGTNGTRDCRFFAAVYLLLRFILFLVFAITRSSVFYAVAGLVFIGMAMILAIVQPYKAAFAVYNVVDIVFVLTMAMWCGTAMFYAMAIAKGRYLLVVSLIISYLVAALPLLYLVAILLHWICSRRGIGRRLVQSVKRQIGSVCRRAHSTGLEESLPDRVINHHDYPMANNSERFSDQAYSSVNIEENPTT